MVDLETFAPGQFEPVRVQSELMHHRGMNVGDVVRMFDRVETEFIRGSMHDAALHAPAGQPGGKTLRMMIATRPLGPG